MKKFHNLISNFKLPKKENVRNAIASFTKKEIQIFFGLFLILIISTIGVLEAVNKTFMVEIPMRGGSLSEGIIGSPRFINPILAFTDVDNDLTSLVYSGLMRKDEKGDLIPDLAKIYEVSPDDLSYTFTLKDDIYFHDGEKVTADDVIFTINEVKNPILKSPLKGNWDGISVEKIDDKTIKFNLKQSYTLFLENTTLGILPKHLWSNTPIEINELNTNPIGSGPYKVKSLSKQSSGIIDSYNLVSFDKFILGKPYIKKINLKFYQNEKELIAALIAGDIDQASSITPENAELLKSKRYSIKTSTLPRVFGLFFNQNQNQLFTDKKVVKAMDLAIDKDRIVKEILKGYGISINDPIPPNMIEYQRIRAEKTKEEKLELAKDILAKGGWKKGDDGYLVKSPITKTVKTTTKKGTKTTTTVSTPATKNFEMQFSISTGNAPELVKSAEYIKEDLESLGIKVEIKTFEIGNLNQSVIRPRNYDALLFGQIINRESDLFAFWHSSQRKDPGLNVSMYTNSKVDKILEQAFVTTDKKTRIKEYAQFEEEISKDMPAIFLYSPSFIYINSKNLKGISMDHINSPSNRFSNVYMWYVATDSIWKVFANKNI